MAEEWSLYLKEQPGPPTVCLVNLAAADGEGPDPNRPLLLAVRLPLREPNEAGLNSAEETSRLHPLEDDLTAPFADESGTWYVGRLTAAGTQTLYFYVPADFKDAEAQSAAAAARHPGYSPSCELRPDPEWRFYFERLLPSELEMHLAQSEELLRSMQDHGDDGTEPRRVEHWIYFASSADREAFKERLGGLVYGVEAEWNAIEKAKEEGESENDLSEEIRAMPFALQVWREQSIAMPGIADAIRELHALAEETGGSYDGWETEHKGADWDAEDDEHQCGPGCSH